MACGNQNQAEARGLKFLSVAMFTIMSALLAEPAVDLNYKFKPQPLVAVPSLCNGETTDNHVGLTRDSPTALSTIARSPLLNVTWNLRTSNFNHHHRLILCPLSAFRL
jgi:hypothetical protein